MLRQFVKSLKCFGFRILNYSESFHVLLENYNFLYSLFKRSKYKALQKQVIPDIKKINEAQL